MQAGVEYFWLCLREFHEAERLPEAGENAPRAVPEVVRPEATPPAEPFAPLLLNYSLAELTALLAELGLVDKVTGWATPAATPGDWVGVFYGLIEAKPPRMKNNRAAAHRAFKKVFKADFSASLLDKGLGKPGSQAEKTQISVINTLKG